MSNQKITKEDVNIILARVANGETLTALATEYDISQSQLSRRLAGAGPTYSYIRRTQIGASGVRLSGSDYEKYISTTRKHPAVKAVMEKGSTLAAAGEKYDLPTATLQGMVARVRKFDAEGYTPPPPDPKLVEKANNMKDHPAVKAVLNGELSLDKAAALDHSPHEQLTRSSIRRASELVVRFHPELNHRNKRN